MVLLRIRDSDGVTGLGEAVPMSLRGGAGLNEVVAELLAWGEDPSGAAPSSPPARCAVETALADLEARREGIPLWKLLDEPAQPRALECNATIMAGDPEDVLAQGEAWAEDGFNVFKLKSGPDDATLSAVGDTHKWMVEGNVMKDTGRLAVRAPATVVKGKAFSINGRVVSADGDTTLTLYKRVAGTSTYQVVGPVQATATGDGSAVFSKKVRITKNTSFKLVWEGDGSHLGATWTKLVRVK